MHKRIILVLFLFTTIHLLTYGQEHKSVLSAPENWQSEIIPFPLSFAPDIDLTGFEDLRFAPSWSDSTKQAFWTYTFVWYIEKALPMTEQKLTGYFNSYYDGLMGVDINNQQDSTGLNQLDKTLCLFIKTEEGFTGKMRVYDRFFTKDYIVFNIKVKEVFCRDLNKQIVFCDISPKPFTDEVWLMFDKVVLKADCN